LDKDFGDLFDCSFIKDSVDNSNNCNFVEVSSEVKEICSWLEESEESKGFGYLPNSSLPKLLRILHKKVENTVIVLTTYHTVWMEWM
jgi:hypothetical protein